MPSQRWLSNLALIGAAGVTALALAGCSSTPSTPSTPLSSSALSSSAVASAAESGSDRPTTLNGKLAAGVENGCVVLLDDSGAVLANLVGLDPASAPMGSTVEVNGQFEPDMMTTCQQGTPFTVASVEVR